MFLCVNTNRKVDYWMGCRKIKYVSASIRYGSWFQQSNLNFIEVLFLTYDIVLSNKHHREHMAVFEDISQYLRPDGGYIYHLAHYMFVKACRYHSVDQFIKFIYIIHIKNPTKFNIVSKFYFIFIWSLTCFGRHTTKQHKPKTALTASGFAYVDNCWMCSCWMLSGRVNHTLPYSVQQLRIWQLSTYKNQILLLQLYVWIKVKAVTKVMCLHLYVPSVVPRPFSLSYITSLNTLSITTSRFPSVTWHLYILSVQPGPLFPSATWHLYIPSALTCPVFRPYLRVVSICTLPWVTWKLVTGVEW
jgi:hypothetical protein